METKRTIELTEEQLNLIIHALGIASSEYNDIHQNIVNKTILVTGIPMETKKSDERVVSYYLNKAKEFADLSVVMNNGN